MALLPKSENSHGADRRREKRYEVQLKGDLGVNGEVVPVMIADISGSGALVIIKPPPEQGIVADLWVEGFGDLEIKVMFSGDGMCGVMFTEAAKHRDRLLKWLNEEILDQRGST